MIFTRFYRTSGRAFYYKLVRRDDNYIWDDVSKALVETPTWVNSAIAVTEITDTGIYPIIIPDDLPNGVTYDVVVFIQKNAAPIVTDEVDSGYVLKYGSIFGF